MKHALSVGIVWHRSCLNGSGNPTTTTNQDQNTMGDRANIVIEADEKSAFPHPVFFYTHWRGSEARLTLQAALIRGKGRWDDEQYLARIIFCEMIQANPLELTSYGISTRICDNEHPLVCVRVGEQKVQLRARQDEDLTGTPTKVWTFEEYVAATKEELQGA